jgi:hypothetical protein
MKFSDWLTKEQAAKRLGVSVKTVERLAVDKKIQKRMRPRIGGSPLAVFHPGDVERLVSQQAVNEPFVVPDESTAEKENQIVPAAAAGLPAFVQALSSLSNQFAAGGSRELPLADLKEKRYLTIAEASRIDGRRKDIIRKLAKARGLIHKALGPSRADLIRRADLDKL